VRCIFFTSPGDSRVIFHPSIDPWKSRLHLYWTGQHYFLVGPQWTTFLLVSFRYVRFRLSRFFFLSIIHPFSLFLSLVSDHCRPLPDDRQDVPLRVPRAQIAFRDACCPLETMGPQEHSCAPIFTKLSSGSASSTQQIAATWYLIVLEI